MGKVSIRFEGIMAFVELGNSLEVLIPNSEVATKHLDGNEAFSHYAWLTDAQPGRRGRFKIREALAECVVSIVGTGKKGVKGGCPGGAADIGDTLFPMRPLLMENIATRRGGRAGRSRTRRRFRVRNDPFAGADAAVTCRIVLKGGEFDFGNRLALRGKQSQLRDYILKYGANKQICRPMNAGIPIWSTEASEELQVEMKFGNGSTRTVTLEPDKTYTVSNLDSRTPEEYNPNDRGLRNQLEDGDFRWYYNLFGTSLKSWTRLRTVAEHKGKRVLGPLPVPVIDLDPRPLSPDEVLSLFTACKGLYFKG